MVFLKNLKKPYEKQEKGSSAAEHVKFCTSEDDICREKNVVPVDESKGHFAYMLIQLDSKMKSCH